MNERSVVAEQDAAFAEALARDQQAQQEQAQQQQARDQQQQARRFEASSLAEEAAAGQAEAARAARAVADKRGRVLEAHLLPPEPPGRSTRSSGGGAVAEGQKLGSAEETAEASPAEGSASISGGSRSGPAEGGAVGGAVGDGGAEAGQVCTVKVRVVGGRTLQRRFLGEDTVADVLVFALRATAAAAAGGDKGEKKGKGSWRQWERFELCSSHPRRVLANHSDLNLLEAASAAAAAAAVAGTAAVGDGPGAPRLGQWRSLSVRRASGPLTGDLRLRLPPGASVAVAKAALAPMARAPPQAMRLVFGGRELADAETLFATGGGGGGPGRAPDCAGLPDGACVLLQVSEIDPYRLPQQRFPWFGPFMPSYFICFTSFSSFAFNPFFFSKGETPGHVRRDKRGRGGPGYGARPEPKRLGFCSERTPGPLSARWPQYLSPGLSLAPWPALSPN